MCPDSLRTATRVVRILIVEDSEDDALLVVREFRRAGFTPEWRRVSTLAELRNALATALWDLVIVDWQLPALTAPEALATLQALGTDTPSIVVSGAVTEEEGASAMRLGARDYISKSNLARLIPATERELREASDRRRRALAEAALQRAQQARSEAEAASRAKDDFVATLAHELRTPLTSMLSYASMLRRPDLDADVQRRALETIERGARTQARLVEDILDMARITTGKLALDCRPTNLAAVVANTVGLVDPLATAAGVRLEAVVDAVPPVVADAARLEQVLWNLVVNAVKFTPEHGLVRVTLSVGEDTARLEVSDTGVGISAEVLPFVFELHRQASDGARGGLGLGLALVRHLVTLHGGRVLAASEGPGKGATFTVLLPFVPPKELAHAE